MNTQNLRGIARTQRGLSVWGVLVILAVIGFFALFVIRLFPVYMENYQVKAALKALDQVTNVTRIGKVEVRKRLQRSFDINDIRNVPAKAIEIKAQPGQLLVRIAYETRVPLVANLDLVAVFDDVYEAKE